jgi:hypothetical protein
LRIFRIVLYTAVFHVQVLNIFIIKYSYGNMLSKFSSITVYCILPYVVQFLEVIAGGQDLIQLR